MYVKYKLLTNHIKFEQEKQTSLCFIFKLIRWMKGKILVLKYSRLVRYYQPVPKLFLNSIFNLVLHLFYIWYSKIKFLNIKNFHLASTRLTLTKLPENDNVPANKEVNFELFSQNINILVICEYHQIWPQLFFLYCVDAWLSPSLG